MIGMRNRKGFNIVELTIIIAILGIISAIAIPIYSNYSKRAQLSNVFFIAETVRKDISSYYVINQNYPSSDDIGVAHSTKYRNDIIEDFYLQPLGKIMIEIEEYFSGNSASYIAFVPSESFNLINWICYSNIDKSIIPAICKYADSSEFITMDNNQDTFTNSESVIDDVWLDFYQQYYDDNGSLEGNLIASSFSSGHFSEATSSKDSNLIEMSVPFDDGVIVIPKTAYGTNAAKIFYKANINDEDGSVSFSCYSNISDSQLPSDCSSMTTTSLMEIMS